MKLHLSLVPFLLLHSVSAQRQQAAQGPRAKAHPAIVAARFLTEFRPEMGINRGARAHGDLDRDGDLDLVLLALHFSTSGQPTFAQSWLNDGTGRFTRTDSVQIAEPNTAAQVADRLELVDLDGDGSLDLLYSRNEPSYSTSPSGLLVAWGNGDGSFQSPLFLIAGQITDFAVGDVEADGDLDLLVERKPAGSELGWYRNTPAGFVPGPQLSLNQDGLDPVRVVDLDGDHRLDVAALNGTNDRVRTFQTQADGALIEETPILLPPEFMDSQRANDLLARDLEGDGDIDLLVVRIYPAEVAGDGYFYPLFATSGGFRRGDLQPTASWLFGGELADWDKDGDLDFFTSRLEWFENTGGAHFVQAGSMPGITNLFAQAGDFDGDGNCDLISGWSFFAGNGSFPRKTSVQAPPYEAPLQPWREDFADFEGDGDLDALAQLGRFENQGDGTFVPVPTPLPIVPGILRVRSSGDFDGDGLRDLLVAYFEGSDPTFVFHSLQLLRGRARGDWERLPDPAALVDIPQSSLVGDIDSDGDQDILTRDGYWENDGAGHFGSTARLVFRGQPFVAKDADQDGDLDLVVDADGRAVLLRNGGGAFTPLDLGASALVDFLDLDSDGDLDLLLHSGEQLALRERLPTGDYAAPLLLDQPAVAGTFGQLDIDADGRLDLLCVHKGQFRDFESTLLTAWPSRPGFTFGERIDWVLGFHSTPVTPARVFTDIDGDGDRDIVGELLVENLTRDASEAGSAVQYSADAATSGSGAIHPILGASGPFAPHERCTLHLARARGGSQAWLFLGQGRARESVAGVEFLIGERRLLAPLTLSGPSGVAGAGAGQLDLRVPGGYFGRTFTFQAIVRDPGASGGFSATNGVEVRFGSAELRKP